MRQSVDARKKPELFYVYTVDVETAQATSIVKRLHNRKITLTEKKEYAFPSRKRCRRKRERPSTGCSRQWPGRAFLRTDACPRRTLPDCARAWSGSRAAWCRTWRCFWETGVLNPNSNVQFGEGGAGTFSDGKLNTLIKDPDRKNSFCTE